MKSRSFIRLPRIALADLALMMAALVSPAHGQTYYTLDDTASPISVTFNGANARMSVTIKATGMVWNNGDSGGGDTLTVSSVTQTNPLSLSASATTQNGYAITVILNLAPATGDLTVTIGGDPLTTITNKILYPYAFFPTDGSGSMVAPFDSGYVVPTNATDVLDTDFNKYNWRRMEWFGGVDTANSQGWIGAILDPHEDMALRVRYTNIGGQSRLGCVPEWQGSNANASSAYSRLSYDRKTQYRFFTTGGYVALAKHFRATHAASHGWVKTLAQKNAEDPDQKVANKLLGAPVLYLWGDGRSTALLDAMTAAGIGKALAQVSVNNKDHNLQFPNQQFANGSGWAEAIRAKGYLPGFYDIYEAVLGSSTTNYDGRYYLWPSSANPQWLRVRFDGAFDGSNVCMEKQYPFARDTRLPGHISQFDLDAYFFDTTSAADYKECYDTTHGHFETRTEDRTNREAALNSGYSNPNFSRRLIVGSEQGRSYSVPFVHWLEGRFWLGSVKRNTQGGGINGSWNDNAYPSIMTDVFDPRTLSTGDQLGNLLSDGYQAPLWDLVFHDCVVSTAHWNSFHNKYLYCWDANDLWAMLRGQTAMLNLTYDGAQGSAGRTPNTLTDINGTTWTTRWTNSATQSRVMQTINTVCAWHETVGLMEMIDHRRLTADRSVQMSEYTADGGATGHGIVVNFGVYDGAYGVTGSTWNGTIRGNNLSVPVKGYATYSWQASQTFAPTADAYVNQAQPTTNYGDSVALNVMDATNDRHSYLKFTVSGITGPVTSAKLRLKCFVTQSGSTRVHQVSNTTWTEDGINWNNKPAMGAQVDSKTNVAAGSSIELDVTSLVTGNGAYTFGVQTTSSSLVRYYPKERTGTSEDPVLEVTWSSK